MKIKIFNQSSCNNLTFEHKEISDLVTNEYKKILSTNLYNIRLMGSVPRGDFREYYSDIDFIAITHRSIDEATLKKLQNAAQSISANFPKMRKVDMETISKDEISDFREIVFKTDSISLFGNNPFTENQIEIDSEKLILYTSPNLATLINEYRNGINSTNDKKKLLQYSLWIGKDILKAFRARLIKEKGIYEVSAKMIHKSLLAFYQEDEHIFNKLVECYLNPLTNATELNKILDSVEGIKNKYLPLT